MYLLKVQLVYVYATVLLDLKYQKKLFYLANGISSNAAEIKGTYLQRYAEHVSYQQDHLKTSSFTNMLCYSVVGRVGRKVKEILEKHCFIWQRGFPVTLLK